MKIPSWLKILVILAAVSLFASVLGAVSQFLIAPAVLLVLMLIPGKDPRNPWLVRLTPWLWSLGMLVSLAMLVGDLLGKELFSGDMEKPSSAELWLTIVTTPPLVWSLVKRHKSFKPMLIASTVVFCGLELWNYSQSIGDAKAIFELVGNLAAEVMLTVYLSMKVRTQEG